MGQLQVRGKEARRKGGDTVCREQEEEQGFALCTLAQK